ncbi:MAG: deoxyribodipyrimidine photo-lyase [Anaerolinea sp.]|nr:deoxyribodipyrimidine photo-lyase [Anaerolinea sp.]
MSTGIWWIRRDMRLDDNPALQEAINNNSCLLPLFILDPTILSHPAEKRKAFMFEGLRRLDAQLRLQGSRLFILIGDPQTVLSQVFYASNASAIYAEADYSPYARKRDHAVAAILPLWLVHGLTVFPPGLIHKQNGSPYTVYTHFKLAWKSLPLPAPCCTQQEFHLPPLPESTPICEDIPETSIRDLFMQPGESAAFKRLQKFLREPIYEYLEKRDLLALDATSTLSPYLRFGMISIRGVVQEARFAIDNAQDEKSRKNAQTWLDELVWREFYYSVLHFFPDGLKTSFRKDLHKIQWHNAPQELEAWKQGKTGYPVVDAGMRQLKQTGWMLKRARMITASFLVKNLLVNWQEGESWFMENLLDGDPALNSGGWQWTASPGKDVPPTFRIFNPTLQSQKFDPKGTYIRRWVAELANVPDAFIHQPWRMPEDIQKQSGCIIGDIYPTPIVDHKSIQERTLLAFQTTKEPGE